MNWKTLIILGLLFIALGYFIGQSCNSNEHITNIDKAISESQKRFDSIGVQIKSINDSLSAFTIQRTENKNYYTYETYKIDSLIQLDSSVVNAIIRARLDKLFRLPEFFIVPADTLRTWVGSEKPSGW
jgi:hypothetical protein